MSSGILKASLLIFCIALSAPALGQPADDFSTDTFSDSAAAPKEVCADNELEVKNSAELSNLIDSFGGYDNMMLGWRLSGLAGVFSKMHVFLSSEKSGFAVRINSDDPKAFSFCADPGTTDVLKLRVHKAKDDTVSLFLLKPGEIGQTVYGACSKSGWRFLKFKKI